MTSIEKDPGSNLDGMICRSGPSWEGCRCSNLPTHLQGCHSSAYHSGLQHQRGERYPDASCSQRRPSTGYISLKRFQTHGHDYRHQQEPPSKIHLLSSWLICPACRIHKLVSHRQPSKENLLYQGDERLFRALQFVPNSISCDQPGGMTASGSIGTLSTTTSPCGPFHTTYSGTVISLNGLRGLVTF